MVTTIQLPSINCCLSLIRVVGGAGDQKSLGERQEYTLNPSPLQETQNAPLGVIQGL